MSLLYYLLSVSFTAKHEHPTMVVSVNLGLQFIVSYGAYHCPDACDDNVNNETTSQNYDNSKNYSKYF